MAGFDSDVLRHSVTKNDEGVSGPMVFQIGGFGGQSGVDLLPDLPYEWTAARDYLLRTTPHIEGYWGTAIHKAISKVSRRRFEVEGEVGLRVRNALQLFLAGNTLGYTKDSRIWGRGWDNYLFQHLRSYLTTDIGAFTEVVYQKGRVVGFVHLDPSRCELTDDPLLPVIYHDGQGILHEMKAHQIFRIVDFEQDDAGHDVIGQCAARDVYDQIRVWYVAQRFIYEKGTGRRPQKISFVGGLSPKQLRDVNSTAQAEADVRGILSYMGAVIGAVPTDQALSKVEIDLVSLPDWFDRQKEWEITTARYASRLGLDFADLAPQRIGGFGSGGQSRVYDDKSKEMVLAGWQRKFLHQVNFYLLDSQTRFLWSNTSDPKEMRDQAETARAWANTVALLTENFVLTPDQALQVLVDQEEATGIPREFLATDVTSDASLTDIDRESKLDPEQSKVPENTGFSRDSTKKSAQKGKNMGDTRLSSVLSAASGLYPIISDLMRRYTDEVIDKDFFILRMAELLEFNGPAIFRTGAKLAQDTPFVESERKAVTDVLEAYRLRLDKLANGLAEKQVGNIAEGAQALTAKLVGEMFWLGIVAHRADPLLRWEAPASSCDDCRGLIGEVRKASEWRDLGYWPRSSSLQCRGFCNSLLRRVYEPLKG